MIGNQMRRSFLAKSLAKQQQYGAMVQASSRGFAGGGPKKAAIDANLTDFDVVFVGKFYMYLFLIL